MSYGLDMRAPSLGIFLELKQVPPGEIYGMLLAVIQVPWAQKECICVKTSLLPSPAIFFGAFLLSLLTLKVSHSHLFTLLSLELRNLTSFLMPFPGTLMTPIAFQQDPGETLERDVKGSVLFKPLQLLCQLTEQKSGGKGPKTSAHMCQDRWHLSTSEGVRLYVLLYHLFIPSNTSKEGLSNVFLQKLLIACYIHHSRVGPWIPKYFSLKEANVNDLQQNPQILLCMQTFGIRILSCSKMKVSCHVTLLKILIEINIVQRIKKAQYKEELRLEMIVPLCSLPMRVCYSQLAEIMEVRAGLTVSLWNIDIVQRSFLPLHCLGLTSSSGIRDVDNCGDPH